MKLRSLFLAGIAAFAMASCSNEVEGIDNGGDNGNTEKNATVRFSIGFPATARAADDAEGTAGEQAIQKITAVLVYTGGSPIKVLEFTKEELTVADKTVTTAAKEVYAGNGTVYVYINPITPITASNYLTIKEAATYTTSLDGLANGIAKENNFLMSGKGDFTAVAGQSDNHAAVTVSRVAAKIIESSPKTGFETTNTDDDLTITLQDYTFTNLNKTSNVLASSIFAPEESEGYFQYFKRTNSALITFEDLAKKVIGAETNITYCLENDNTNVANTQVWYKAQATSAINQGTVKNLYVVTKGDKAGIYSSFIELDKAYGNLLSTPAYENLSDGSTYEAFNKYGIKKYTDGICYYAGDIKTGSATKIVRNNIYKLTVKNIAGLGEPGIDTPDPGESITMLDLGITIDPWTINENGFDLQ